MEVGVLVGVGAAEGRRVALGRALPWDVADGPLVGANEVMVGASTNV